MKNSHQVAASQHSHYIGLGMDLISILKNQNKRNVLFSHYGHWTILGTWNTLNSVRVRDFVLVSRRFYFSS